MPSTDRSLPCGCRLDGGWTEPTIVVTPTLSSGFNLKITGRDRNQIKDYLGELFQVALSADIDDAVQGIAA